LSASAQNKELLILKNKTEVALLLKNSKGDFVENYIFQCGNTENFTISNRKFVDFIIIFDKKALILKIEKKTYYFIVDNYIVGENVFRGYGLSRRFGIFTFDNSSEESFFDTIRVQNSMTSLSCTSGGAGSTECSITGTIGPVSSGCSVSCGTGYYACCDDGTVVCQCVATKPPKTITPPERLFVAQVIQNKGLLNFSGINLIKYNIDIYNLSGTLINTYNNIESSLSIENLNSNIYIYKIYDNKGYDQTGKFIKN
jgi:hypothetical protein